MGPREPEGPSRADVSDDWGRDRKPPPSFSEGPPRGHRGGFGDRFGSDMGPSRADSESVWVRRDAGDDRRSDSSDRWSRKYNDPPPAGERPRLKLAPRTLPLDNPPPAKQGEAGGEAPNLTVAPPEARAPKPNPFGAARPREEVLKEQGKDPIKEELRLEASAVEREDTPEEKALKQEVMDLRVRAEAGEDVASEIEAKEIEVEKLRVAINDRLRFEKDQAGARAG